MKNISGLFKIVCLFAAGCLCIEAGAQTLGYDLSNIIYTPGTENPIKDIVPINEAELSKDKTLDIVNWNVDWLGAPEMVNSKHGTREEHIGNIAEKLVEINADIIALQEVVVGKDKGNALEDLVNEMNRWAGSQKYAGKWSDFHSYYWNEDNPDYPPQCLAYVWNKEVVSVNNDSVLLQEIASKTDFGYGRLPYLLDANITLNGKTQRYMFVNIHLKAKKGFSTNRAMSMDLLRSLLNVNFYANNVVLIGDYNVADDPGAVGEITDWGFYGDNEEDGLTDYVHAFGYKNSNGGNNIEHALISSELFDELAYVSENQRSALVSGTKANGYSGHYAVLGRLYVHEETGNVDPKDNPIQNNSEEFTMLQSDYQVIVDYANTNDLNSHDYPKNSENHFGASAYYSNFDIEADGSWDKSVFDSWEEAVQTAIGDVLLPVKYPNAEKGEQVYKITFKTWNGNVIESDSVKFVCSKSAPELEFELYVPVSGVNNPTEGASEIYPNPNSGSFAIRHKNTGGIAEILDMKGRLVFKTILAPGTELTHVDLQVMHKGVYSVRILCCALECFKRE